MSIAPAFTPLPGTETVPVFDRWFGSWQVSVRRRPLSSDHLAECYDHAAANWGQTVDRLGFGDGYAMMLEHVLDTRMDRIERVLDCGVGTGALSKALDRVVQKPFALDAVDISKGMLDAAGTELANSRLAVTLRQADARALPFADETFDIVMSAHMLEHLTDPRVALSEMFRVLKPGGLLLACVTRRSALGLYVQLKWRTHGVTPHQAAHWLSDSGFDNVHAIPYAQRSLCRRLSLACVGTKPNHPPSDANGLTQITLSKTRSPN